ncbi:hypothetical protein LEP1GSC047_0362 [Leptospira inadai serovar Lyme str. 10]|uniref:Activator of Hsp90 ATPase homologue 1/2-like C-terminal domain-containing protein n=2 Tax=Leptospira inadai serovar Lyme TaxID=293084 RepID=V6HA53_9LEPT|nr:SRPBCC family protein [Leptospira inadai]EQA35982.1 hypothetical protein LEP1GSC047_0362 [Leptospira inadai serovar Lyme str. 10]PNV76856.1 ATPase [Leptospira inadai serovar Lyme]
MEQGSANISDTSDREISTTRIFNAPRDLVWKVWTDPNHVAQWWGPNGFTNTVHEMSVKPGGVWRLTMHGPDGVDYPNKIVYFEVIKPERLVYSHGSGDEENPGDFHVTVTFTERDGKTEIFMRALFKSAKERDQVAKEHGAIEGMKQTMDRLEQFLAKLG